jgi:DNA adenine methylase
VVELRAPFPYAGAKSRIADTIWRALGPDVPTYIEPFCGSAAVLLGRPRPGRYESLNDSNGLITNVWRSIKLQPEETARFCFGPPNEIDLQARARCLQKEAAGLTAALVNDPEWCEPRLAGWWIYCQSLAINPDWLNGGNAAAHKGSRKGVFSERLTDIGEQMALLAARLERVQINCGDWERLVTPSALGLHYTGTVPVGVAFDPPYPNEQLDYGAEPGTAERVADWCRENGSDARLRIVLAGHLGDYDLPGWRTLNWGGSAGWGREKRGANECLWFSPGCLPIDQQPSLFGGAL